MRFFRPILVCFVLLHAASAYAEDVLLPQIAEHLAADDLEAATELEAERLETLEGDTPKWRSAAQLLIVHHLQAGQIDAASKLCRRWMANLRQPPKPTPETEEMLAVGELFEVYLNRLKRMPEADRLTLVESERAMNRASILLGKRQFEAAAELAMEIAQTRGKLLGADHFRTLLAQEWAGKLLSFAGDNQQAETWLRRAVQGKRQTFAPDDAARGRAIDELARVLVALGKPDEAIRLYQEEISASRIGEAVTRPRFSQNLVALAQLLADRGQIDEAESLLKEAVANRTRREGVDSRGAIHAELAYAKLLVDAERGEAALPIYHRVMPTLESIVGADSEAYTEAQMHKARALSQTGATEPALTLLNEVLQTRIKLFGMRDRRHVPPMHYAGVVAYAHSQQQIAGENSAAEARHFFLGELTIRDGFGMPDDKMKAEALTLLAETEAAWWHYEDAIEHARDAIKIWQALGNPNESMRLRAMTTLADAHLTLGNFERAAEIYRVGLAVAERDEGANSLAAAEWRVALAGALADCESAQPGEIARVVAPVLALSRTDAGERDKVDDETNQLRITQLQLDPHYYAAWEGVESGSLAKALAAVSAALEAHRAYPDIYPQQMAKLGVMQAGLLKAAGEDQRALAVGVEAATRLRQALRQQSVYLAEDVQLANWGGEAWLLGIFVSMFAQEQPEEVYAQVLPWKGAVFVAQRRQRVAERTPEGRRLRQELQQTTRRLASAMSRRNRAQLSLEEKFRVDLTIEQMTVRKNDLEMSLAELCESAGKARDGKQMIEQLSESLSEETALVDWFSYDHVTFTRDGDRLEFFNEPGLVAFVTRPGEPTTSIVVEDRNAVEAAIDSWRETLGVGGQGAAAADRLRAGLWAPVESHLSDAKTVLISPDGALSALPFAGLPGAAEDSYLLEDYTLVTAPVAALLLEEPADQLAEPSLVAVGGVDYDSGLSSDEQGDPLQVASRSAARSSGAKWAPLAGAEREATLVVEMFRKSHEEKAPMLLRGTDATEQKLRDAAPKARYLHLATHGFFAPEHFASTASADSTRAAGPAQSAAAMRDDNLADNAYPPGLLSGLVLAGANRPVEAGGDDGIFTASEASMLDLSAVELVTLSACETGLGKVAGGEGVLGLQRSLRIAGARSVVSSLWAVDDAATQLLMTRFYDNLWRREMSKAEALREAQLWLMNNEAPEVRAAAVSRASRGARWLQLVEAQSAESTEEAPRLPPYFWAAFVLSGEWE